MANTPCVLGVDVGTQSLRAGLFDLGGWPIVFADEALTTRYPQPGWAEQSPAEWWSALVAAGPALAQSSQPYPEQYPPPPPPAPLLAVSSSINLLFSVFSRSRMRAAFSNSNFRAASRMLSSSSAR